jgi:hypothetical protein
VGINATTGGAWTGGFGSQGAQIAGDGSTLPSYAAFSTNSPTPNVWAPASASNNDNRDLQTLENPSQTIAADWYGSTFNVTLNLTDGQTHQVALYVLDWEGKGRAENITLLNASTSAFLASANAYQFYESLTGQGGSPSSPPKYIVFNVSGNVTFRFTDIVGNGPAGAVLSGLFLDPVGTFTPPTQTFSPTPPPTGGNILLNGSFEGNNGIVHPHPGGATNWNTATVVSDPGGQQPNITFRNSEGSTAGTYAAVFNDSETYANGILYQSLTTVPGQTYTVGYDFGNYSSTATSSQQLLAQVFDGAGPFVNSGLTPLSQLTSTDSLGTNNGVNAEFLARQTFTFTAVSTTSTIQFTDKSTQASNSDGVLDNVTVVPVAPPTVVSVTPEDNAGNGIAAGSAARGQRSMETQIAVVFSAPVNLAAGAFSLGLVNNFGSGTNDGSPATILTGVLGTPANPSGDGITWIIPILSNSTNSYVLKGTQGGISGASLNNGVYQLNVIAADVTTATGGIAMTANYTSAAWHRLYGDVDNARREFNTEYASFLAAFTSTFASGGATNYNQDLDYDGDGRVFNTDYAAFLADFGSTMTYSEPQS